jgi:uncharacterized membrane protein
MTRPLVALVAAALMSVGAVAANRGTDPRFVALVHLIAICAVALAAVRAGRSDPSPAASRTGLAGLGLAAVAVVLDRHEVISSAVLAPDDILAGLTLAAAVLVALRSPMSPRARALVYGLALATYATAGAVHIAAKPYHSDAVVAAHGGAELVLAGRHPYADFDMAEQLPRFGLGPEWATDLDDGTSLSTLNYPVLAVLVPVPAVAAGATDIRILYLAEVLALIVLVALSCREPWRAFALAAGMGSVAVMRQHVAAGIDPTWALLVVLAWLGRRHRWSAVAVGLAVASRQTAWLVAPFLIAEAWQRGGRREALARSVIAAAVALAVHAPFLVTDAGAVVGGITDVLLRPLLPGGVALSALVPGLPREVHLALTIAALAGLLVLWWRRPARTGAGRSALVLAFVPLALAPRALMSYFALLPTLLLVEEGRCGDTAAPPPSEERRRPAPAISPE